VFGYKYSEKFLTAKKRDGNSGHHQGAGYLGSLGNLGSLGIALKELRIKN